ncbi:hypothetical protein Dda_7962 [Drechslerella dactyloides]|uniref:Uncharacterized protein n=1 Tax=Drechslerella dactyloides TaxID=74499 RepID=A0AAD6NGA3_DREDA|nr:hypothetical protein Dda_7962 [Drechslerella dactyloides]
MSQSPVGQPPSALEPMHSLRKLSPPQVKVRDFAYPVSSALANPPLQQDPKYLQVLEPPGSDGAFAKLPPAMANRNRKVPHQRAVATTGIPAGLHSDIGDEQWKLSTIPSMILADADAHGADGPVDDVTDTVAEVSPSIQPSMVVSNASRLHEEVDDQASELSTSPQGCIFCRACSFCCCACR